MVPLWVVQHPAVHGDGTRIAVYVAVRILAFENPDRDWRSDRELAVAASEVVGVGSEAARKHLRALRQAGIIGGTAHELILPADPVGYASGDQLPLAGDQAPLTGDGGTPAPITNTREIQTPTVSAGVAAAGTHKDVARTITDGYWKWVQQATGKPPVGVSFIALVKLLEPVLAAGYEVAAVKAALVAMYSEARPITRQVIEQQLDGRAAKRPTGGRTRQSPVDNDRTATSGKVAI